MYKNILHLNQIYSFKVWLLKREIFCIYWTVKYMDMFEWIIVEFEWKYIIKLLTTTTTIKNLTIHFQWPVERMGCELGNLSSWGEVTKGKGDKH